MKRYLTLVFVLAAIAALGLVVGCQNDKNPNSNIPGSGQVASIELRVDPNLMRGFKGELRTAAVTAVARTSLGAAVQGVKIEFSVPSQTGTIAPSASNSDTVTNTNGEYFGTYTVQLAKSASISIQAKSGNVNASATVTIDLIDIGSVSLEAPSIIIVPSGQVKQATVTASVQDDQGIGLSGVLVHFRTSPANLGTVDSDTGTTDFNGQVKKTFSTIAGRTGTCTVIASVGDSLATRNIEIVEASKPAVIKLLTDHPSIQVAAGQDAQINLLATVTDEKGRGVPDVAVDFSLEEYAPGDGIGGAINIADTINTTDANGQINAIYTSLGWIGKVSVVAKVLPSGTESGGEEAIQDKVTLVMTKISTNISGMTISADPYILAIARDTVGKSTVSARIIDLDNNGIPNVVVQFSTSLGSLARPTVTDSTGTATVEYRILPRTDFTIPDDVEETATIMASLANTNFSKTVQITIRVPTTGIGTLQMTTDTDVIYADNGVTFATLTIILHDADGQVMPNELIKLVSDFVSSSVASPCTTGADGLAHSTFKDIGVPCVDDAGNPRPVTVTAKYEKMGLEASVQVYILPKNPVTSIALQAASPQKVAGSIDSTLVWADCFQVNGQRATDGTEVDFRCSMGRFTADRVFLISGTGRAETYYIAPARSGTARLQAIVINAPGDTAVSNIVTIEILAGPPSYVRVVSDKSPVPTNDPNEFATITATVTDTMGNPVARNTNVAYTTTLGTITPNNVTDSLGQAKARLTPGVTAGFATVTASVTGVGGGVITNVTTVEFTAGEPNSIELTADPILIQVAGTGGHESSTLSATVRDPNGNLLSAPVWVYFELIRQPNEPEGCNINRHGQLDSAQTANGIARATLNSGTRSGPVLIHAYTWRDLERQQLVEVTLSSVQVVSGPPVSLDLDVNDKGKDLEGGAWAIEVSARVYDFYRNPVASNIPVAFSVDPDIASITAAYTGNYSQAGDSAAGIAYATMSYNSNNTFDTLTISANVETPNGAVTGELMHTLPLQDGTLQLNCDPTNWMFDRNSPDDLCLIRVWGVLMDGHQQLINNGPILFTSNRAKFYWKDVRGRYNGYNPGDPAKEYTGWRTPVHPNYTEPGDGISTVYMRGIMDDFFLDAFTLEVTVQINALVEGYNDVSADPGFVFMTRH